MSDSEKSLILACCITFVPRMVTLAGCVVLSGHLGDYCI